MTRSNFLGFKPATRLDKVDNKHSERVQDRNYRSALRREPRLDEIFRKNSEELLSNTSNTRGGLFQFEGCESRHRAMAYALLYKPTAFLPELSPTSTANVTIRRHPSGSEPCDAIVSISLAQISFKAVGTICYCAQSNPAIFSASK
jgi:hypothetical protein